MSLDNLKTRLNINKNISSASITDESLIKLKNRLDPWGGTDQWTRMRQDKLRSLKKALLYSYQKAIVQKYDVKKDNLLKNIISIITAIQNQIELSENQKGILNILEQKYLNLKNFERDSVEYIEQLENILDTDVKFQPMFRCLINHDKLKVAYEDKIISIPFFEPPVGENEGIETNFHNGTVFKWIHGNKEEWTPDTYWIVYMQYSEETAYFRGQIRKADQEIEIITIDSQGNQSSMTYRGWMTGPDETSISWNIKKGIVWNDLNYTKILYITKDEDTLAFFQRFDRVIINGQPWEIQAYNENYSKSKNNEYEAGIIRVALKEAYTDTEQFVKERLEEITEVPEQESLIVDPYIEGPTSAKPYDIIKFSAKNFVNDENYKWTISNSALAKIIKISEDNKKVTVEIITSKSSSQGFDINYGNSDSTKIHVIIKSIV